jgi:murein DD-endopeptidase MepM/ murein hydrolase activator NlpD
MDYKHRYRSNKNPLLKSKMDVKCVFKPRRSVKDVISTFLPWRKKQPNPPFEIKGHDLTIEYGLSANPQSTTSEWGYRLNSKIVVLASLSSLLALAWWLNQSDASIGQPTSSSVQFETPKKVSLFEQEPLFISEPIKVKPPISPPKTDQAHLNWLHLRIQPGETLSRIFKKHQLNRSQLYEMTRLPEYAASLRQLQLNQPLHIRHDPQGNIEDLILVLNKKEELHLYQEENEFIGEIRPKGMRSETVSTHCVIKTSLAEAAKKAGLSDKIVTDLAEIFSWELDFDRDMYPGDQLSLIYKRYQIEGDIETGDILAAEVINLGSVYRALRYTDKRGYTDYYTPTGESLRKIPLIRAPVKYTRISSPFGTRKHPILGKHNFHTGTDYAAPTGTPIIAAGDAVVKFVGRKGGYGKTIVLAHNKRVRTLYAHLYKFAQGLRAEQEVFQGEIIGYVGQSGRATGPHLHYEIQLDGQPKNPRKIALPLTLPLLEEKQAHFAKKTRKLITKLDALSPLTSTKLAQETLSPLVPLKVKREQSREISSLLSATKRELEEKPFRTNNSNPAISLPQSPALKSVLMQHSVTTQE